MNLALRRRALILSWVTVGYNLLEGTASVVLGALAGSPALIGFALDSFMESLSGAVMIWRFGQPDADADCESERERRALKLIGWTFLALGAYVLYEALEKLYSHTTVQTSLGGIIIAILSLLLMPWLAKQKLRVAEGLGSASLRGDAKETLACAWLSAALLLGLTLNYLLHWWWADPVAGLIIVFYLWREGLEMTANDEIGCECRTCGGSESCSSGPQKPPQEPK